MNQQTAIILLGAGILIAGACIFSLQLQLIKQRRQQTELNQAFNKIAAFQLHINRKQTELNNKNNQAFQTIADNMGKIVKIVTER